MTLNTTERHIVLVHPEIHWNTGNIGRTCVATDTFLHLIKPLGFELSDKHVKRAGLDYWEHVKLSLWESYDVFCTALKPQTAEVYLYTKNGERSFREMERLPRMFLVFGAETKGLPQTILQQYPSAATLYIPMLKGARSLNLSTSVGIALYESLRGCDIVHAWK